jgi:hypothetical protein
MTNDAPSQSTEAAALAQQFHEAYERLAPEFNYETREASAVPWEDVPDKNKRLMVAVAADIIAARLPVEGAPEEADVPRGVHEREEGPTHLFGGRGDGPCPYPYADGFCGLLDSDHLVVAPSGKPTGPMWVNYHAVYANYMERSEGSAGPALWEEIVSLRREIETAVDWSPR